MIFFIAGVSIFKSFRILVIYSCAHVRCADTSLVVCSFFLVEVAPGDIDPARLSARQRDAACGLYAQATAGYSRGWRRGSTRSAPIIEDAHVRYRELAAHAGLHRRTPGIVADLFIGWERFLGFAHETAALTRGEAEGYRMRVWSALIEVARRQSEHLQEANRNAAKGEHTRNPVDSQFDSRGVEHWRIQADGTDTQ